MKLKKMLSILLIPLVLSSNSYAAYINHHYGEKTEEKFVSEYMNSNSNKSEGIEFRHMYMGYAFGKGKDITKGTVTLGVANYSFDYLFEDYEIEINGEWVPVGVIDE